MTEVELVLELPTATLVEVIPKTAQAVTRVTSNINVIAIVPTEAAIASVQDEIGVVKHAVTPAPGIPLLFVLAGDYKIPLRPEVECKRVLATGATFPVFEFDVLGLTLQIVFPDGTPSVDVQHFEEILVQQQALTLTQLSAVTTAGGGAAAAGGRGVLAVQPQWGAPPPQPEASTADRIVAGITAVGSTAASGLRSGAMMLAGAITAGARLVVDNTDRRADEHAVAVPETWAASVRTARMASKGAVVVSSAVARSLVGVTSIVTDVLASRIRGAMHTEGESETVSGLKTVGVTTADQAVQLYEAVSDAARTILTATCAGICQVVDHKLGRNAGTFTEDALGLVQDGVDASRAVANAGTAGIVKAVVHDVAVKTLEADKP